MLIVGAFSRLFPEEGVSHEYDFVILVSFACAKIFRPGEDSISRCPLRSNHEDVSPILVVESICRILKRDPAFPVRNGRHQAVSELRIPLEGEIFREMSEAFVAPDVSIFMIAWRNDIRHLAIKTLHAVRSPFPHLLTCLIQHFTIADDVLVLLYQIAGEKYGFDIQVVDVICAPDRAKLEQRLIDVIFSVALRIPHEDHGKRSRVSQVLLIGTILGICGNGNKHGRQSQNNILLHFFVMHYLSALIIFNSHRHGHGSVRLC